MAIFGKKEEAADYDATWKIVSALTAGGLEDKVNDYIAHGFSPVFASYVDNGSTGMAGWMRFSMIVQR